MTKVDTWNYQWVYNCWLINDLSVYQNVNLVSNIGFGANTTHTFDTSCKVANKPVLEIKEILHPKDIKIYPKADRVLFEFCHSPKLSIRDKAYLTKERLKKLAKTLSVNW
jgi:hypothetical protein